MITTCVSSLKTRAEHRRRSAGWWHFNYHLVKAVCAGRRVTVWRCISWHWDFKPPFTLGHAWCLMSLLAVKVCNVNLAHFGWHQIWGRQTWSQLINTIESQFWKRVYRTTETQRCWTSDGNNLKMFWVTFQLNHWIIIWDYSPPC